MKISLKVDGKEMFLSEEELVQILREHLATRRVKHPEEGIPFDVNPMEIDRSLFEVKRDDLKQEKTRQMILKAFEALDENPEKYGKSFQTLMPEKNWSTKSLKNLVEISKDSADHMADLIEQSLEWAQRIANGESWEALCNEPDTAKWYRLIAWNNGYRLLGGSSENLDSFHPATDVCDGNCSSGYYDAIPLLILPVSAA